MSYPDDKLELEEQLQKIDCEDNNAHCFEGEMSCIHCGISFNEAYCDDYDEGER